MVGIWKREKSLHFPLNFQPSRNWCLLSMVQRGSMGLVVSCYQSVGQGPAAWAPLGSWWETQHLRPHPGPESESAFSQDPRWFRVLNSLSLISPMCEIGLVKPTWQIHLRLNKMFVLSHFPLPGVCLCANSSCLWLRARKWEGLLSPTPSPSAEEATEAQRE